MLILRNFAAVCLNLAVTVAAVAAEPAPDREFVFQIGERAFGGGGPVLCFDDGHENYHRAGDLYAPFISLIERDGIRTQVLTGAFSSSTLSGCNLLAIVSPVNEANVDDWALPIASAFNKSELVALHAWIRSGGGLLLVVDHHPIPAAANGLLTMLGVASFDGEARNDPSAPLPDIFTRDDGGVLTHAITEGRNASERIDRVATWTGHAFLTSRAFQPLLVFGEKSRAWFDLGVTDPEADWRLNPVFEAKGWAHASARKLGEGRVVVLGEAAMCTAELSNGGKVGMNAREAPQNAQFCLNTVRWLTGALELEAKP